MSAHRTTVQADSSAEISFDVTSIRSDFPILQRTVRANKPLVYLDSGATAQRPACVIDAEQDLITDHYGAVGRSSHQLADESSERFGDARVTIAQFIGARRTEELIFTAGATASLNLVAYALGNASQLPNSPTWQQIRPGDNIVVTEMEHHANLVPWQELCRRTGATLRWLPLGDDFRLDISQRDTIIDIDTKVVAITQQSNVLGTIPDLDPIREAARRAGALIVLDACQSIPHRAVDVAALDVDFVAFSGHKMLGPTGVGGLWGKYELLEQLPPFLYGGSMIEEVFLDHSTYLPPPERFEAGTPPVTQAVALAAAAHYLTELGMDAVSAHADALTGRALAGLAELPGVRILGPESMDRRGAAVAFLVDGIHSHDVGQLLDDAGVAVRVGHHCAAPLHRRYGVTGSARATFNVYNTADEVDALIAGVQSVMKFFAGR